MNTSFSKSVTCCNIPTEFLDKNVAKKYFSNFGVIKSFSLRPNRLMCTVEYEASNQAEEAKQNAGSYKGHLFTVEFTSNEIKSPTPDPDIDPDVQSELQALRELSRGSFSNDASQEFSFRSQMIPIKRSIRSDIQNDVEQLLRRQCNTAEERYRLLDARDKLIRQKQQRDASVETVRYPVGTCPDMCPERERYMRDFQNQVSTFELDPETNEIDYRLTVKQYSRSSADQESPLAHELRSEDILQMTMGYLVGEILDLSEDEDINISEWFHFVWDRMRGIRKDITHQNLCTLRTVELLEQCARFHIHCSARLVAEHPSVFDPKLNTENLTKCLQSLKYTYDDLRLKGIKCKDEAEFRSYIVLLNLNDGKFLWEFKNLAADILASNEIKFALLAYTAISSNNYVKFFQLVSQTTYLNACILLRYFTQVRIKALKAITKAYSMKRSTVLPLDYLIDVLKFENNDAALRFLEHHEILIDESDVGTVTLDSRIKNLDLPFIIERSMKVVESKREISVGEIVLGKHSVLSDTYKTHTLYDSFDDNGYLTKKGLMSLNGPGTDETDRSNSIFKVPSLENTSPKAMVKKVKKALTPDTFSFAHAKETKQERIIATEPLDLELTYLGPKVSLPDVPSPSFSIATLRQSSGKSIFSAPPLGSNDLPGIISISRPEKRKVEGLFEVKLEQTTRPQVPLVKPQWFPEETEQAAHHSPTTSSAAASTAVSTNATPMTTPTSNFSSGSVSPIKHHNFEDEKLLDLKKIEEQSKELTTTIITEVVEEEVKTLTEETLKIREYVFVELPNIIFDEIVDEVTTNEVLELCWSELLAENILEARKTRNLYKALHKWLKYTRKNVARRRQLDKAPIYLPKMSLSDAAQEFKHPVLNYNYSAANLRHLLENKTFDSAKMMNEIKNSKVINVENIFKDRFSKKRDVFWNGFVILPNEEEAGLKYCTHMEQWLTNTFTNKNDATMSNCLFKFQIEQKYSSAKLAACLEIARENINIKNMNCISGVIFVVYKPSITAAYTRLQRLISQLVIPNTPIAIIVTNCDEMDFENESFFEAELHLNEMTNHSIFLQCQKKSLKKCFENALEFVSHGNDIFHVPLEMDELGAFLIQCIGTELWYRLQKLCEELDVVSEYLKRPADIIKFYNEAITHVIDMVNHNFSDYPCFPTSLADFLDEKNKLPKEFQYFPATWKQNPVHIVVELLKSIELPEFMDAPNLRKELINYIKTNMPLIEYRERLVDCVMLQHDCDSTTKNWINIFRIIATEHFEVLWKKFRRTLPNFIVYHKDEFTDYIELKWFLRALKTEKIHCRKRSIHAVQGSIDLVKKKGRFDLDGSIGSAFDETDMNEIIKKAEICSNLAENYIQNCRSRIACASKENEVLVKYRKTADFAEVHRKLWYDFEKQLKE